MNKNLNSGNFDIVSVSDQNLPIGIDLSLPAWQTIHLGAFVHDWNFLKVSEETYRLSIGGYPHTGVLDGKVVTTTDAEREMEWKIVYRKNQRAFTIVLADEPHVGWTVTGDSSGGQQIEIKPITEHPSGTSQFLSTQLFVVEQ